MYKAYGVGHGGLFLFFLLLVHYNCNFGDTAFGAGGPHTARGARALTILNRPSTLHMGAQNVHNKYPQKMGHAERLSYDGRHHLFLHLSP